MNEALGRLTQRAQLVGGNRMELLLFRLNGNQLYGINVFKVQEIIPCPKLSSLPNHGQAVRGVAHVRGQTISILDLGMATGQGRVAAADLQNRFVIVTEYSRQVLGFLVRSVERIVNLNWESVHRPPQGTGKKNYLTAVTEVDGEMVSIIDIERIIAEAAPTDDKLSADRVDDRIRQVAADYHVLVVDDSAVAQHQMQRCLDEVGVRTTVLNNGREALDYLHSLTDAGNPIDQQLLMMISDIEMPEMDGYTLTTRVKADPKLQPLHILLHTSLSGIFNEAMVKKVGADDFLAKYSADDLAGFVIRRIQALQTQ